MQIDVKHFSASKEWQHKANIYSPYEEHVNRQETAIGYVTVLKLY